MKPFRFRAARLLAWRRAQTDAAAIALSRAQDAARETQARMTDADERCRLAARAYLDAMTATADAASFERHRYWIARQQANALSCRRSHQDRCRTVDEAADAVRLARRRVRIMERLRDRAWRRYSSASRRAEMKDLDQLATLQFARRMSEGGADRER